MIFDFEFPTKKRKRDNRELVPYRVPLTPTFSTQNREANKRWDDVILMVIHQNKEQKVYAANSLTNPMVGYE